MTDEISAYAKGVMGENAACDHLCQKGMQMLERRFRSPVGEVDLIMLDGSVLVFVEVKSRQRSTCMQTQYSITPLKQRRLAETARYYLARHPEHGARVMRFDAVLVARDGILHIPNAYEGREW